MPTPSGSTSAPCRRRSRLGRKAPVVAAVEPLSVLLKYGFLIVLYLFLLFAVLLGERMVLGVSA